MSKEKKFPALYNIIKNDDIATLMDYFHEYPDYDIFKSLTYTGSHIYEHSIELESMKCFQYLVNRLNLDGLQSCVYKIVHSYKKNRDIFEYFYAIVKKLSEEENDMKVINKIVIQIVKHNQTIYKDLFMRVSSEYDFLKQFKDDIFRKNLETVIVENKSLWIIYFEKYYRENNINRNYFFVKCMLYSKFDNEKFLKIFKNMDYTERVKIEKNDSWDYIQTSKHEYSLEFIISITSEVEDFSKLRICKEGRYEEELLNLFSEVKDMNHYRIFKESEKNMFFDLMKMMNSEIGFFNSEHLIQERYHKRLLKMIPYVSNRFMDIMKENLSFEGFDIDKYLKEFYGHTIKPLYVKNSRILLQKMIEEFDKVHGIKL